MIYGVRPWALLVGAAAVAAAGLGTYCARRTPAPPKRCTDSVEIVSWQQVSPEVECSPGARVEIYPAGQSPGGTPLQLVKCVCPPRGTAPVAP